MTLTKISFKLRKDILVSGHRGQVTETSLKFRVVVSVSGHRGQVPDVGISFAAHGGASVPNAAGRSEYERSHPCDAAYF